MPRKIMKLDALHEDMLSTIPWHDDEPPLTTALVGAAFVEKALVSLLASFFVEGSKTVEQVLSEKGFLGELFKCAQLAYCVGLITKPVFENIGLIGQIRNEFAHNHLQIDFEDSVVGALCDQLKPIHLKYGSKRHDDVIKPQSPEDWLKEGRHIRFRLASNQAYLALFRIAKKTEHRKTPTELPTILDL